MVDDLVLKPVQCVVMEVMWVAMTTHELDGTAAAAEAGHTESCEVSRERGEVMAVSSC